MALAKLGREIAEKIGTLFTREAHGYRAHTGEVTGQTRHAANVLDAQDRSLGPTVNSSNSSATAPTTTDNDRAHANPAPPERVPLTTGEKRVLYRFTEWDFQWINRRLSDGSSLTPTEERKIGELRSALSKLPDFHGRVIRRADVDPGELEKYQEGRTVTEPRFTSSTKNPDAPYEGKDGRVEWRIESKTGKDVSEYSHRPPEEEVLFMDGTSFHVSKRFVDADGRTVIVMTEIDR